MVLEVVFSGGLLVLDIIVNSILNQNVRSVISVVLHELILVLISLHGYHNHRLVLNNSYRAVVIVLNWLLLKLLLLLLGIVEWLRLYIDSRLWLFVGSIARKVELDTICRFIVAEIFMGNLLVSIE